MSFQLSPNSLPNLRLQGPVNREGFTAVVVALKETVQEKQDLIDELGATIDGKSHLELCELQKRSFASIRELETEWALYDVDDLVESFQTRKLPLTWFRNAFELTCRSDDAQTTALRTIGRLAKLDAAPCTVRDLVDAKIADGITKMLSWGSFKQRWYAAAACAELTAKQTAKRGPTNRTIGECPGLVEWLVELLKNARMVNCGDAKHDAAAALANLAREPSLIGVFSKSGIVKEAYLTIVRQPQEADADTTELLLVALSAQAWHNQGIAASMYESGYVKVLMTLMKDGVNASKVFRSGVRCEAAYALARVLEGHNAATEFFDDDKQMDILTGLLTDGARHPDLVQMGALSVMNALTGLEDLDRAMHFGEALFKAGVMDACLKLLSPSRPLKLRQNAGGAVANMCAVYTDCHTRLIEASGIQIFAHHVTKPARSDVEREHALLVLYHLARCGTPYIARRIATAADGLLLKHLKKQALRIPPDKDADSQEAEDKRKLLEHSVDLMHMIVKKIANDAPRAAQDDSPAGDAETQTASKRARTE